MQNKAKLAWYLRKLNNNKTGAHFEFYSPAALPPTVRFAKLPVPVGICDGAATRVCTSPSAQCAVCMCALYFHPAPSEPDFTQSWTLIFFYFFCKNTISLYLVKKTTEHQPKKKSRSQLKTTLLFFFFLCCVHCT
jgi:hypothetical protein